MVAAGVLDVCVAVVRVMHIVVVPRFGGVSVAIRLVQENGPHGCEGRINPGRLCRRCGLDCVCKLVEKLHEVLECGVGLVRMVWLLLLFLLENFELRGRFREILVGHVLPLLCFGEEFECLLNLLLCEREFRFRRLYSLVQRSGIRALLPEFVDLFR